MAPEEAFQVRVGVRVATVVPGGELPPGDRPVGVAGGIMTLTVKYTTDEVALDPAELEADTAHMYVAPFCSVGQVTELVDTFWASTVPPPTCDAATE